MSNVDIRVYNVLRCNYFISTASATGYNVSMTASRFVPVYDRPTYYTLHPEQSNLLDTVQ